MHVRWVAQRTYQEVQLFSHANAIDACARMALELARLVQIIIQDRLQLIMKYGKRCDDKRRAIQWTTAVIAATATREEGRDG